MTEELLEEFCGRLEAAFCPDEAEEQKTNRIMEAFDTYFVEKQGPAPHVSDPLAEAEWEDVRQVRTIAEEEEEDEAGSDEEEAAERARALRLKRQEASLEVQVVDVEADPVWKAK